MTRALIIGGSGGLGRAMAETFAKRGDAVLVTSRDRTRAEAIAAEIGENTEGLALDLPGPRRSNMRWPASARSTTWSSLRPTRPSTVWRSSVSPMPSTRQR